MRWSQWYRRNLRGSRPRPFTPVAGLVALSLLLVAPGVVWAYKNWQDNRDITVERSTAKVKVRGKITEIPVFRTTQENCIFVEAEVDTAKWTGSNYKRPDCVKLRNRRVRELSNSKNPSPAKDSGATNGAE